MVTDEAQDRELARIPGGPQPRGRLVAAGMAAVVTGAYAPVAMPILAPALERAFGLREGALGVLLSAAAAGGVCGGLVGGWLADRLGRLRVLRWLVLAAAAGGLLCAAGSGRWALTLGLVVFGFGQGGLVVAWGSLLSSLYPERRRAGFSALLVASAAAGIGFPFLVTPLQSAYMAGRLPFGAAVGLPFGVAAVALALVAAVLSTVSGGRDQTPATQTAPPPEREALRPELIVVALVMLLTALHGTADGVLCTWMPRYLTVAFRVHPFPPGWVMSFYSAAYLAGRTGLILLPDRLGRRALLVLPGLMAGPLCLAGLWSGSFSLTAAAYVAATLLYGLEYPALMALASQRFPSRFATVYGLMNAASVVSVVGVWAAGRWTQAVGSMRPALSTAACGFLAFGLVAAWALMRNGAWKKETPQGQAEKTPADDAPPEGN